jgi:hypothetical protein
MNRVIALSAVIAASLAAAALAHAQIYRYRDPQTGQVKYTNIPPPWLKNPGSRGPKVDVIREPQPSAAPPPENMAPRDAGAKAPGTPPITPSPQQ